MLVARRDPFHSGAHDASNAQVPGGGTARLARTVGMLQVAGSLLAIPIGLASAYSIYRANFSVETTCQGLRSDIISMIGKSIDAGTRRMLVRRDVEKFEQSCGAIDPDATAAFKALLAKDKPAIAAVAPVATPAAPIPCSAGDGCGPQGRATSADGRQNAGRGVARRRTRPSRSGRERYAMARCGPASPGDA